MSDALLHRPLPIDGNQSAAAVQRHRRPLAVAVVALLIAGAGWAGTLWGHHQAGPQQLTGVAYASPYQISATVDGWTYDIPLTVPWIDADGRVEYNSRPACLPASTKMQRVTFAEVPVSYNGVRWREVVWVSCRH